MGDVDDVFDLSYADRVDGYDRMVEGKVYLNRKCVETVGFFRYEKLIVVGFYWDFYVKCCLFRSVFFFCIVVIGMGFSVLFGSW